MKARKRVKRLPQSLFLYFIFSSLAASENSQSDRPVLVLLSALLPRVSVATEHKLASAEKKNRWLEGENGGWKEFLNSYDKGLGLSVGEPSRRSDDVLVAFLSTFKKKEDLHTFLRWQ
ncbi:hypothetical protein Bca4012_077591 [Brassica carinata]